MSIEVRYLGRLGNHLFQYAFGRILAEKLGYELRCVLAIDRFIKRSTFFGRPRDCGAIATLPELASHFRDAPQLLPGKQVDAPEERYIVGEPGPDGLPWDGQRIDQRALLSDRRERRLILRGYFQRFDYYREHQAQLREWFALEPLVEPYGVGKRDLLVNVRRGWDYAHHGWVISMSSYRKILRELPHDRLFVCGTGLDDAVRAALAEFSPIYYRASPIDEFRFIMKFDRIVQSNSTFCWWASFLSRATAVYTPQPDRGFFAKDVVGDWLNTGEARYRVFDAKVARFVPFRPNREATTRLERDARGETSLIVERAEAEVTKIACAPSLLRFYQWLVERREPFGVDALVQGGLLARQEVEPVIGPLVDGGAIVLEERFVDD